MQALGRPSVPRPQLCHRNSSVGDPSNLSLVCLRVWEPKDLALEQGWRAVFPSLWESQWAEPCTGFPVAQP